MRKVSYIAFMFAVMLLLCVARWKAQADLADPEIFVEVVPAADFDLTDSDNSLVLTISPLTSGYYSYSFALMSGDAELVQETNASYYNYVDGEVINASFAYAVPDEGEKLRYKIDTYFDPDYRPEITSDDKQTITSDDKHITESNDKQATTSDDEIITESIDKLTAENKSSGGSSCSVYPEQYNYDGEFVRKYFRFISSTTYAEITNINGVVYVEIL